MVAAAVVAVAWRPRRRRMQRTATRRRQRYVQLPPHYSAKCHNARRHPHAQLLLQGDVVKSGSEGAAAPSKDAHHGDARHGHEHHH